VYDEKRQNKKRERDWGQPTVIDVQSKVDEMLGYRTHHGKRYYGAGATAYVCVCGWGICFGDRWRVSKGRPNYLLLLFIFFSGFRLIPEAKTDLVDGENENVYTNLTN
jgi:hypothetical protein